MAFCSLLVDDDTSSQKSTSISVCGAFSPPAVKSGRVPALVAMRREIEEAREPIPAGSIFPRWEGADDNSSMASPISSPSWSWSAFESHRNSFQSRKEKSSLFLQQVDPKGRRRDTGSSVHTRRGDDLMEMTLPTSSTLSLYRSKSEKSERYAPEHRQRAAVVIQAVVRGFLVRKKVLRTMIVAHNKKPGTCLSPNTEKRRSVQKEQMDHIMKHLESGAAFIIQCRYRRYRSRCKQDSLMPPSPMKLDSFIKYRIDVSEGGDSESTDTDTITSNQPSLKAHSPFASPKTSPVPAKCQERHVPVPPRPPTPCARTATSPTHPTVEKTNSFVRKVKTAELKQTPSSPSPPPSPPLSSPHQSGKTVPKVQTARPVEAKQYEKAMQNVKCALKECTPRVRSSKKQPVLEQMFSVPTLPRNRANTTKSKPPRCSLPVHDVKGKSIQEFVL